MQGVAAVEQAADFAARVEFEARPASPLPGQSYSIAVYLANYGKRAVRLKDLSLTVTASGNRRKSSAPPLVRSVEPQARALLQEVTGSWDAGETSWSLRATVTNDRNDTCTNVLTWR
jgi:hypothetical protein